MPRFKANRWWTLILTLWLGCVFVASFAASASANPRMLDELGGRTWGEGNGTPQPPPDGDPDIPMSSIKKTRIGAAQPSANSTVRAAGDGMAVDGVMMWHWRVLLQNLRYWSLIRL